MARLLLFLLFFGEMAFACSGNCFACHQDLEKGIAEDGRHVVILECINCHKDLSAEDMGSDEACAGDCFMCHQPKKLIKSQIPAHQDIEKCRECHLQKYDIIDHEEKNPLLFGNEKPEEAFLKNKLR